ncbi:enoyl-[acyl-carrier-protein] reductase [Sporobolomyces salmoneus]|uniref:enoyl-[acyl-carrier-protein] reductase n=1 Tax=Sporobolomyces salmoneus TaxID=183962 RepID=UPI0031801064
MLRPTSARLFTSTSRSLAGSTSAIDSSAIVFVEHGSPTQVLQSRQYRLPELEAGQVRLRFELGAINPADINVIQGVYPSKPVVRQDLGGISIMGNEGVATVEGFLEDGTVENKLKVGDKVVMGSAQLGTWASHANIPFTSLIPLPSSHSLTHEQSATLAINPPTAYRMLTDFIPLNPHEQPSSSSDSSSEKKKKKSKRKQWIIQNGSNSAVGQSVIQLCREWGIGTINLVRDRPSIDSLKKELKGLGADHVLTYEEFLSRDSNVRKQIKEWVGKEDGELLLGLNCVGGKETTEMAKLLGVGGKLVTYGGMAKTALSIPPSLFIFKKLTSTGFWLSNWTQTHPVERISMMNYLSDLVSQGKLKEPDTKVVALQGTDEEVEKTIKGVMEELEVGRSGKKVLLRWQDEKK